MGHVEERIADFVAGACDIPEAAREAAHRSAFDAAGCVVAAVAEPAMAPLLRLVRRENGLGPATVLGAGLATSASGAALANGALAHRLDYDDGRTAAGHAASVLLPAALAVAEPAGLSGADLLDAYAVGLEVATHVSDACRYEEKNAGFHRTALFGTFGATAVAARLLRLDRRQTLMALGIAGSMPSGVCQNFGTDTKPLHAGLAARGAVTAAQLAADGWTGSPDILGGPVGWPAAYVRDADYAAMAAELGEGEWRTARQPPMIKRYPCCGASHGPLDSLLALRTEHGFTADDVEEVEAGATYDSMVMMVRRPTAGVEGKFSLGYTLAVALVDGRVDVDSFTDATLARPEVGAAMDRVRISLTSKWDGGGTGRNDHSRFKPGDGLPVRVRLRDGSLLERSTPRILGLQTWTEIEDKFRANVGRTVPDVVGAATKAWRDLPDLADVREATAAFSR